MSAYYNENDKHAAAWLRELIADGLIAPGEVDERSILYVEPSDLRGFDQCHFFAGIGGWSYALRLAGVPDDTPIWTGSCPCQPYSSAASGRNARGNDDRNLWLEWRRLIAASTPRAIFGEQVAHAGDWLDGVCDDLENMGYAIGAAILPAVAVGCDHARARIFFVGNADRYGKSGVQVDAQARRLSRNRGDAGNMAHAHGIPGRMGRLKAYGNAIVPRQAAAFIEAAMECIA